MKYRTIEFTKKFNLGNYETQDIKIQVEVEEGENVDEVFLKLKKKVLEMGNPKEEQKMTNGTTKEDFYSGNFLKAESCKGGEIVKFLDEGEITEITTPEGKVKAVMNFQVDFNGVEKTFTPNKGNADIFLEAWGENWIGKKFKVTLTKVKVFGKMKNSIVAEPILEEGDKVPVVKPQKMDKEKKAWEALIKSLDTTQLGLLQKWLKEFKKEVRGWFGKKVQKMTGLETLTCVNSVLIILLLIRCLWGKQTMKTKEKVKEAVNDYAILKEILGNAGISINEGTIDIVQEALNWVLED